MSLSTPPTLSVDAIDDILYFARTNSLSDLDEILSEIGSENDTTLSTLLLAAIDPNTGNGPLHMASANGHAGMLSHILATSSQSQPSLINAANHAGNTPLHYAALNGHLEAVKILLEAGANTEMKNEAGHDAIYEAERNEKEDVVAELLRRAEDGKEEGEGQKEYGEMDSQTTNRENGETENAGDKKANGIEEGLQEINLNIDAEAAITGP